MLPFGEYGWRMYRMLHYFASVLMQKIISKRKVRKQKKPKTRIASYKVSLLSLLFLLSILHWQPKRSLKKQSRLWHPLPQIPPMVSIPFRVKPQVLCMAFHGPYDPAAAVLGLPLLPSSPHSLCSSPTGLPDVPSARQAHSHLRVSALCSFCLWFSSPRSSLTHYLTSHKFLFTCHLLR